VDGTCRVRQTRVKRTSEPMSLKGREPQEGRLGLRAGKGLAARTLRGRRSLWELGPWTFGSSDFEPVGGMPRGRRNGEEECGEPMTPLHRSVGSER
jgi:hypothetical protein